jgi:hypothetical protein
MLFVTNFVPHVQRIRYQKRCLRVSLIYRRTRNWHLIYCDDLVLLTEG